MDILDIFLDILLKPPQPLIGLFFRDDVIDIDHVQFIHRSGFSHDERPNYL